MSSVCVFRWARRGGGPARLRPCGHVLRSSGPASLVTCEHDCMCRCVGSATDAARPRACLLTHLDMRCPLRCAHVAAQFIQEGEWAVCGGVHTCEHAGTTHTTHICTHNTQHTTRANVRAPASSHTHNTNTNTHKHTNTRVHTHTPFYLSNLATTQWGCTLPTGSAPLSLLQAGNVGVTQPRRVAATSTAARVAAELGTPLGQLVGYQVRKTACVCACVCDCVCARA